MRSTYFVFLFYVAASCSLPEKERETSILSNLPSSSTVLASTKGTDDLSTAALQRSALATFDEVAGFIGLRDELPASAYSEVQTQYRIEMARIEAPIVDEINATLNKTTWKKKHDAWLTAKFSADRQLLRSRDSLFAAYMVPLTQAEIDAFHSDRAAASNSTYTTLNKIYQFKEQHKATTEFILVVFLPLTIVQIICILLIIGLVKGYRYAQGTVELAQDDPTLLIADGVRHSLKCYTGQVIHSSSGIERITNVHGNQNYVESSSYSVEHDKFHVVDTTGKEHAVHLWNSGVQVRPGSIVSAAWFEGPHAEKSGYAIFVNHDTDRYTALWSNLEKFFHSRSSRMATNGFWLAVFSAGLAFYTAALTFGAGLPLVWFFIYLLLQALMGIVCWLGALLAFGGKRAAQRNRFAARDVPRMADYLRNNEVVVGPTSVQ